MPKMLNHKGRHSMKDIWEEKPMANRHPTPKAWYYKDEMDVWLDKLKAEWDILQYTSYMDEKIAEGIIVDKKLKAIKTFLNDTINDKVGSERQITEYAKKSLKILDGKQINKIEKTVERINNGSTPPVCDNIEACLKYTEITVDPQL